MAKFVTLDNLKAFKKKLDATSGSAINAYPVGAIYISVKSTNPGELFGGSWTQLKDPARCRNRVCSWYNGR